jgi:S1-C subfamily serine protease
MTHREIVWRRRANLVALAALVALLVVTAFALTGRRGDQSLSVPRRETAPILDAAAGATLEPLDRRTAHDLGVDPEQKGVVVTSLATNGPAARAGVRTGDVIARIGKINAVSERQAAEAFAQTRPPIALLINRHGHYAKVQLPIRSVPGAAKMPERGDER